MDLISLGLTPRKSKKILQIINNNRVSRDIELEFNQLNSYTKAFLVNQLSIDSSQQEEQDYEGHQLNGEVNDNVLQVFQELYFLLDVENFKFNHVYTDIDLNKLKLIYMKLTSIGGDGSLNDNTKTVLEIIEKYIILTTTLSLTNSLIYKTLILKNQQVYWQALNNSSTINKLIYFMQTSPIKLYNFGCDTFAKTRRMLFHNSNDDGSKVYQLSSQSGGKEEDNIFSRYLLVIKNVCKLAFNGLITFVRQQSLPLIGFIFLSNDRSGKKHKKKQRTLSIKWYLHSIKSVIKFPINLVVKEAKSKLRKIDHEIALNVENIDKLIKTNPKDYLETLSVILQLDSTQDHPTSQDLNTVYQKKKNMILQAMEHVVKFDKQSYDLTSAPGFLTRYWIIIALVIFYGPSQTKKVYANRQEIIYWVKYNGIEPVVGFFKNWVIKPVYDMLDILRNTSSDSQLSITSKDSLNSEFDSLNSMIYQFAQDNHIDVSESQITDDIKNGDLKIIMSTYENEIKSPIKYLITGSLLRLILIQIQKGKVDGAMAINGIDKLLKSQQLLFAMVSISPSILILYQMYRLLTNSGKGNGSGAASIMINGKQLNIVCLKCLNNIENLLILLQLQEKKPQQKEQNSRSTENVSNKHHQEFYEGELLIEIINLFVFSSYLIPVDLKDDWIDDLNELNNKQFDVTTKLDLIRKIWNMYGAYFR